jgi:carboxypeptidase family protein/dockerin type I repeat protein
LIATAQTQPDGSFYFEVSPGNYTVTASAAGFLQAQANVASLNAGITRILPTITLLAGDIDGNNIIDQFDALTIGMNYNGSTPSAADLNNDGIINVLDLELLAENYRDTGPTVWQ